jgi:two-component SAPR family response regulator
MNKILRFMIVDDDPLNNSLCKFVIRSVSPDVELIDFTFPEKALEFILLNAPTHELYSTIMLLDINMPVINGWDFLKAFDAFDEGIRKHFTIYILSSSIDWNDKERAKSNPYVRDYLIKPLNSDSVTGIIEKTDLKDGN